jgi:hypothetical protein
VNMQEVVRDIFEKYFYFVVHFSKKVKVFLLAIESKKCISCIRDLD